LHTVNTKQNHSRGAAAPQPPWIRHCVYHCAVHAATTSPLALARDENGRKTSQPFSTFTFGYENKNESDKAGHENEHELMEYREFRK